MKSFILLLLQSSMGLQLLAQTTGTLNVSVTTSSAGGNYAPRNIVAIWIEDSTGNFVKTLLAYADRRITHLNNWESSTSAKNAVYNRIDAVTAATQNSHGVRICTWNGTDYNKKLVADGKYFICMELTDKNATGNYSKFAFIKGKSNMVTPVNAPSFSSISIQWESSGTVDAIMFASTDDIKVFPNPSNTVFYIRAENIQETEVLTLSGELVCKYRSVDKIDLSNLTSGIYLLKVKTSSQTVIKKVVKE